MRTELKYRTFDELMDEVSIDFSLYSIEGLIEPAQLIKIAQKVTYDLGLRIHMTKETMVEIHNGKAKLPDDFYVLDFAMLCYKYRRQHEVPMGRHTEDVKTPECCPKCEEEVFDCTCPCPKKCKTTCTNEYHVVQTIKHEVRVYEETQVVRLDGRQVVKGCPNLNAQCASHGTIRDGYIYFNIQEGNLYIKYTGSLEDEDGNLLVLDHPMINEYYETALKVRILENLYFSGEPVQEKLGYIKQELRVARNNALGIVNMPDFAELKAIHDLNRAIMHGKYYRPFASRKY